MKYPYRIVKDYANGKITREQFTRRFGNWQRANRSEYYECKGYGTGKDIWVTYRGAWGAILSDGVSCESPCGRMRKVKSVAEFKRLVDLGLCAAR